MLDPHVSRLIYCMILAIVENQENKIEEGQLRPPVRHCSVAYTYSRKDTGAKDMGAGVSLSVGDVKDDGSGELKEDHEVLQCQERDRGEMKAIFEADKRKYPPDASFLLFYAAADKKTEPN